MYMTPERQTVDALLTVAPSIMQVLGAAGAGARTTSALHATLRLFHDPLSQRYCVPAWQLVAPEEYVEPLKSHAFGESFSVHATASDAHSPSSHRNWVPDWQVAEPCEYIDPL